MFFRRSQTGPSRTPVRPGCEGKSPAHAPERLDKLAYLSRINLFKEMAPDQLQEIGRRALMSTASKGALLIRPGDRLDSILLLKEGHVRIFTLSPEGREYTLAILGGGNIFGEIETFSLRSRDMYAEAMDDCVLCVLKRPDVEALVQRAPGFAMRLLEVLSDRLRDAEEAAAQFALGSVKTRLLHILLNLCERYGVPEGEYVRLDLELTHQELANMTGSTRETVSLTLSGFAHEGLVRTGRKQVRVNVKRVRDFLRTPVP